MKKRFFFICFLLICVSVSIFGEEAYTTLRKINRQTNLNLRPSILYIYGGTTFIEHSKVHDFLNFGIAFDLFIGKNSFGWTFFLEGWKSTGAYTYSNFLIYGFGTVFHFSRKSSFDPFISLEFSIAQESGENEEYIDFPFEVGANFWMSWGFGAFFQYRIFLFTPEIQQLNGGFTFSF